MHAGAVHETAGVGLAGKKKGLRHTCEHQPGQHKPKEAEHDLGGQRHSTPGFKHDHAAQRTDVLRLHVLHVEKSVGQQPVGPKPVVPKSRDNLPVAAVAGNSVHIVSIFV